MEGAHCLTMLETGDESTTTDAWRIAMGGTGDFLGFSMGISWEYDKNIDGVPGKIKETWIFYLIIPWMDFLGCFPWEYHDEYRNIMENMDEYDGI